MSYLLFAQCHQRQMEKEEELLDEIFEEMEHEESHILGKLTVDGEVVPYTNVTYEKLTRKIEDKANKYGGWYYKNDGYKIIVSVVFPPNLARKYMVDYVTFSVKDDEELQTFLSKLENGEVSWLEV
jgi:hypothetical protein